MNLTVSTLMDSELENKFQDFLSLGELWSINMFLGICKLAFTFS
jgi:hypothetical protein